MDKKTGKAWTVHVMALALWLSCLAGQATSDASVLVSVTDGNGKPFESAGIGIPFLVEVEVISSTREDQHRPQLVTEPRIQIVERSVSRNVYAVNGKTTIRTSYTYQAVADEEGQVIIGPATVDLGKGRYLKSNTVKLSVTAGQVGISAKKQAGSGVWIELKIGTETPFVGQAVPFSIRFYAAQEGVHLEQLQEPLFKGFKHGALQGPVMGKSVIHGIEHQYLEWKTTLFPLHEGRLVIPSLLAYVSMPAQLPRGQRDMFSLMNHMFGGLKSEEIYSNALMLQVKPLPQHDPVVTAVGTFSSFHTKLSATKAEVGEGITLTLELVGQGNFPMIGHPQITVPEGLKYYDSHAKEHQLTDSMVKKDFEYVLQAVKPGSYIIPAQTLYYFDVQSSEYKAVHSRPLTLEITGQARTVSAVQEYDESEKKIEQAQELPAPEQTIKGGGTLAEQRLYWLLFLGIALLIVLPVLWRLVSIAWITYQIRNASHIGYRQAIKRARSRLTQARQKHTDSELYHIFMDLFAARLQIPRAELSEQHIEAALQKAGLSEEQIIAWRKFFARVMSVAFSALPSEGDLYEQAEYWLTIVEQLL